MTEPRGERQYEPTDEQLNDILEVARKHGAVIQKFQSDMTKAAGTALRPYSDIVQAAVDLRASTIAAWEPEVAEPLLLGPPPELEAMHDVADEVRRVVDASLLIAQGGERQEAALAVVTAELQRSREQAAQDGRLIARLTIALVVFTVGVLVLTAAIAWLTWILVTAEAA